MLQGTHEATCDCATPLPAPDHSKAQSLAEQLARDTEFSGDGLYNLACAYLAAYQSVRESGPMFQLLTGERVMLHGCRIIADKDVPQDEAHIYDHRGNLTGRITGLTARRTGGTE
jgi:hypothetical protein